MQTTLTLQQRRAIHDRVAAGQSDRQIADAIGCSRWTVRKWRRRLRDHDATAAVPPPGRPPRGALSTFSAPVQDTILTLRRQHPGWGADTILATLRADPVWQHESLPSRARVAALLREHGLTQRYQPHRDLPQASHPPQQPHQCWEMDARGAIHVAPLGKVSLITVQDRVSRLLVESYPCVGTTKPAWTDYQLALRRAYMTYGRPHELSLDRDTVFLDNTHQSPFPTRLHLWCLALGIDLRFIRSARPTDHGLIERSHQTMERQAIRGQTADDQAQLWAVLDQRRAILNEYLPRAVLDGRTPWEAYPHAGSSGRFYQPEWEADLLDMERIYVYLATGEWFRRTNPQGRFQLAGASYYLGPWAGRRTIAITFDPDARMFVCRPDGTNRTVQQAPHHLDPTTLMGELAPVVGLPTRQLALPFTATEWRVQVYTEMCQ